MRLAIKQSMGLWLCIPAILFLAEPNIGFRDLFPNCIGYLLLCAGLSRAAEINDYVADAVAAFKKMVWISVGAMLAEYYLHNVLPTEEKALNTYESPTMLLLFSFVMLVLKCYFLLPACRDLFQGLGAFAERHGGEKICEERHGKTISERMSRLTRVFVVLLSVLSLLPELAVLGRFEYETEKTHVDWFRFVELFRTLALFAAIALSIYWLIRVLSYIVTFLSDRSMCCAIEERYERETRCNVPIREWRRYRFAFWFLMLGAVFFLSIRMDDRAVLPSAFCALFGVIGVFWTGVSVKTRHRVWILLTALLSAVCSIAAGKINDEYFRLYLSAEASYYSTTAYRSFLAVRISQIAEVFLVLLFWLTVLVWLYSFIKEKARVAYNVEDDRISARATEKMHRRFRLRVIVSAVLFTLSAVGQVFEILLRLQYPWLWWICVPISLAAVLSFVALLFALSDHLEEQAQSEKQTYKA